MDCEPGGGRVWGEAEGSGGVSSLFIRVLRDRNLFLIFVNDLQKVLEMYLTEGGGLGVGHVVSDCRIQAIDPFMDWRRWA